MFRKKSKLYFCGFNSLNNKFVKISLKKNAEQYMRIVLNQKLLLWGQYLKIGILEK